MPTSLPQRQRHTTEFARDLDNMPTTPQLAAIVEELIARINHAERVLRNSQVSNHASVENALAYLNPPENYKCLHPSNFQADTGLN